MKTIEYNASLDNSNRAITALVLLLFLLLGYFLVRIITHSHGNLMTILFPSGLLFILFCLLTLASYFLAPQSYKLDSLNLTIVRRAKDKVIKLADIIEVRNVDYEMNRAIRLIGVGGLFGYFGKHYALKIGAVTVYASQRKNRILIQTNQGQKIIITPDDDISMLEQLKELMKTKS